MQCYMCGGTIENKKTTFTVDLDGSIVVIKNVPSQVCTQCGEVSYSDTVAKQIEKIVGSLRHSLTEIAVVNYTDKHVA